MINHDDLEIKCMALANRLAEELPIDLIPIVCRMAEHIADIDYLTEKIEAAKFEINDYSEAIHE